MDELLWTSTRPNLVPAIVEYQDDLRRLRQDIHAHPELCFEEHRTSRLIVSTLESWGIETHVGLAKTGVVGILKGRPGAAAIGLRADIDGLPLTELSSVPYRSTFDGKMHACGHDGHTAMLLAAARYLAANRDYDGTVYLIFQPAEEGGGGAREMIREGLFDLFPMDAIFGLHNWPGVPVGTFALRDGPVQASSNQFKIVVRGRGAHAAMPHQGIDPLIVATQLVQAYQSILTRNKNPLESGVISVTMLQAGEAVNVIPDHCTIQGTVRTFSSDVLDLIEDRMRSLTKGICRGFGATYDFSFVRKYPPTVNDRTVTNFVRDLLAEFVDEPAVIDFEPTMGAEDFSFFLERVPGCYLYVGNGDGAGADTPANVGPCMLHSPYYDFNDDLITLGGSFWVRLVERWSRLKGGVV